MAGSGNCRRFVLIGGMPRSGTTLVKTIVGSHSRIAIPPGDFPYAERAVTGLSVEEIFAIFGKKTMKPKKSVLKTKKRAMGRR